MAWDQSLAEALIDGSRSGEWSNVKIFGRRLRKFSLWHAFLLKAANSPFMAKKPVTLFDVRTAIGICRLKYPDSHVVRPKMVPTAERVWLIARALLKRGKLKEGEDNIVQKALRAKVDAFLSYTADYNQNPEYSVIPPETSGPKKPEIPRGPAPDDLETLSRLIAWTGWSDEKVWNLPIGYANWLRVMALRDAGVDVDFTTAAEKEFQKLLPEEYRHGR